MGSRSNGRCLCVVVATEMRNERCVSGDYCETTTDQCQSLPCGENGTCDPSVNGTDYRCTGCAGGYEVSDNQLKCIG